MAVSSITVTKKDYSDECNLIAIHSPVSFEIEVSFPSSAPESLQVDIYDENSILLGTFLAIPYIDTSGVRTFVFLADEILRGYMPDVDDFVSTNRALEFVPNNTKIFTIVFTCETLTATETFVAAHAVRQYGDTSTLNSIYNNDDFTYHAGVGLPVYAYFYNNDTNNILSIGEPIEDKLLDYDNIAFTDADNIYFISL